MLPFFLFFISSFFLVRRPLSKHQKMGHTLVLRLLEPSCLVVVVRTDDLTHVFVDTRQ